jgi:ABC-type dipeptide/oligopeptide/nickel transport system ATPase component
MESINVEQANSVLADSKVSNTLQSHCYSTNPCKRLDPQIVKALHVNSSRDESKSKTQATSRMCWISIALNHNEQESGRYKHRE